MSKGDRTLKNRVNPAVERDISGRSKVEIEAYTGCLKKVSGSELAFSLAKVRPIGKFLETRAFRAHRSGKQKGP